MILLNIQIKSQNFNISQCIFNLFS